MKMNQLKSIYVAVELNIQLTIEGQGELLISGLEGFTQEMCIMFDKFMDQAYADMRNSSATRQAV